MSNEDAMVRSLDMNPVYQNLRLSLSQADADLAAVRGQLAAQQGVVSELKTRVEAIPKVEAELARLNRDYEVNKRNYDTLVQRLESAKISESAEQSSDNVKFRVIEPPIVPIKPSGPHRAILNALVFFAALGAGIGLAILLGQLHPTFTTREALRRVAGVTVIGTITSALQAGLIPWYRRQSTLVAGAFSLLLLAFIVNLVLTEPLRIALRSHVG
jgi:polysaccharide chain length determinant protein (PEP-CTERM system associated)